jgi:hypothetical protein
MDLVSCYCRTMDDSGWTSLPPVLGRRIRTANSGRRISRLTAEVLLCCASHCLIFSKNILLSENQLIGAFSVPRFVGLAARYEGCSARDLSLSRANQTISTADLRLQAEQLTLLRVHAYFARYEHRIDSSGRMTMYDALLRLRERQ